MKIEIWSDVICPFCYIGKRKFESALDNFIHKDGVEIVWRSFQLDPDTKGAPGISPSEYLVQRKGISLAQANSMNAQVTAMAREVGLNYRLDKAIVANTFDAHRLSHLATAHGLGDKAEERLFKAYFEEGKNIEDKETLVQLGVEIGLKATTVKEMLATDAYANNVRLDQYEAQKAGARGVPFFVFNNQYAVSGAQAPEVFSEVLTKAWEAAHPMVNESAIGSVCTPDGVCS